MQILLLEPFFTGSHQLWAKGYQRYSRHEVNILSLPGRYWKWRMFGGAVSLAKAFQQSSLQPDLILASDMLDLSTFLALCKHSVQGIPTAIYFHENQITYPWSPSDKDPELQRNNQYGFINYTSALVADRVFFNSAFHRVCFLSALPGFLAQFPDHKEVDLVENIKAKSEVLPLGLDLEALQAAIPSTRPKAPIILWNHRWEYDKAPEHFFEVLENAKNQGLDFKLIVLGQAFSSSPKIFETAKASFADQVLHFGYAADRKTYAQWLNLADILPVSSRQDFFGGSTVEAIYCQCHPLLPDRLAYPEHIPPAFRPEHLYPKDDDLLPMLIGALNSVNEIRGNSHYRDFVAHYDWRILAPQYDERLENVLGL